MKKRFHNDRKLHIEEKTFIFFSLVSICELIIFRQIRKKKKKK